MELEPERKGPELLLLEEPPRTEEEEEMEFETRECSP